MIDKINIETKNGIYDMDKDTFIRWLCLVEMIQLTEEKAKELKINLEKYDWVKPVAIKKYMSERFKSMEIDLEADERNEKLKSGIINNNLHTLKYCSQTYQKQTSLIQNQNLGDKKKHVQLE